MDEARWQKVLFGIGAALWIACGPPPPAYEAPPAELVGVTVVPPRPEDPGRPLDRVIWTMSYDLRELEDTLAWLRDDVPASPERDRALGAAILLAFEIGEAQQHFHQDAESAEGHGNDGLRVKGERLLDHQRVFVIGYGNQGGGGSLDIPIEGGLVFDQLPHGDEDHVGVDLRFRRGRPGGDSRTAHAAKVLDQLVGFAAGRHQQVNPQGPKALDQFPYRFAWSVRRGHWLSYCSLT